MVIMILIVVDGKKNERLKTDRNSTIAEQQSLTTNKGDVQ